jgi:hypothetical protein
MRGRPNSVARVFDSVRSRIPTIALWPDWVTRGVVNPRDTLAVGFMPAPPHLGSFGPAPVGSLQDTKLAVFVAGTIGTTAGWFDSFVRVSGAACRAVGCRGVILGGDCAEPPVGLADCVVWRPFWPLAQVLPYADVLVHHGGIGTAARALEHGVPQLIVPRVFAQASNAEWLLPADCCARRPAMRFRSQFGKDWPPARGMARQACAGPPALRFDSARHGPSRNVNLPSWQGWLTARPLPPRGSSELCRQPLRSGSRRGGRLSGSSTGRRGG